MAQLADDTSPRRQVRDAAYYAELRRKLDAPIQAIPAATGSLSPVGRPALPPWVQAKLNEQARQKAEADALRRLSSVNQPTIASKPSTKWPKIAPSQPKPSPTPRFTAPPAPAPTPPVDRAFQRGTPEYNARIKEMLNARTQGIPPAYGSPSTPDEPARRTDPTPSRPFSLLSDPDDELSAARLPVTPRSPRLADILRNLGNDDELTAERVTITDPPPPEPLPPRPAGPPPLSPEAEQQLWDATIAQEATFDRTSPSAYTEWFQNEQLLNQALEQDLSASVASESAYERVLNAQRIDQARLREELAERILVPQPPTEDHAGLNPSQSAAEFALDLGRRGAELGVEGAQTGVDFGVDVGLDVLGLGVDTAKAGLEFGSEAFEFGSEVTREAVAQGFDGAEAAVDFGRDLFEDVAAIAVEEAPRYLTNRVQDASDNLIHITRNPQLFSNSGEWNQALGMAIAAGSACEKRQTAGDGRVIYENCRGLAKGFLDRTGQGAFTVGSFIFDDGTLKPKTEYEEIAHVDQYDQFGGAFLPLYLAANLIYGYDKNPFEVQAKRIAKEQMTGQTP